MHFLIQLFRHLLAPAANKFLQALSDPKTTQKIVQQKIFNSFLSSEYGKSLDIQSLDDWYRIPIIDYDDLHNWLEQQDRNSFSLLTPEPILFCERTSGSRGAAKLIPYTKSLRRSFNQMFCIWAHDLITRGPSFSTGKTYFCISPSLGETDKRESAGIADDSDYLDGWLKYLMRPFWVSLPGLNRIRNVEEFKEKLCLALLVEEKLEIISIWSPTFFKVHLDYIQCHRERLRRQLGNRISVKRAQFLLEPAIPWTKLWSNLKLISCWDSAHAKGQANILRSLFPGVLVQGKGLLATEAPMTIPLIEALGCVPVLNEVFFEFEDEEQNIYQLHEVEIGAIYAIIISQKGGLYRYRIGDRVRVTHFYRNTPCLEFLGRDRATSDLVGEKLREEFVAEVLESLQLEGSFCQTLIPVTQPKEHYLLLLDGANESPDAIAKRLDAALMQSYHYRRSRHLGQLARARVLVSKQFPETHLNSQIQGGKKWGDIKHQVLATPKL
ncbi:MAG: GH3 auxin-responsive promoter family protein [Cyanobacteriota bacterium]|nr:GH3 auxin-responsive promoter family protein [Cyanobacteriota bacterium]